MPVTYLDSDCYKHGALPLVFAAYRAECQTKELDVVMRSDIEQAPFARADTSRPYCRFSRIVVSTLRRWELNIKTAIAVQTRIYWHGLRGMS